MSGTNTGIEMPQATKAGIWLSSLGNTDLAFEQGLARSFPLEARLDETSTARSNRSSWGNVLSVLPSTPEGRVAVLLCGLLAGPIRHLSPEGTVELSAGTMATFSTICRVSCHSTDLREVSQIFQTSSATTPARNRDAEARFEAVFQRGSQQRFEDGMESEFSRELESLAKTYGVQSKDILTRLLEDEHLPAAVRAEAMRWISRVENILSHETRLWLLEKGLSSSSAAVRDGAALGLASMDDPSAIPYLERAVNAESVEELRRDLEQVLSQLKTHG